MAKIDDSSVTRRRNRANTAVVPTSNETPRALRPKYNAAYAAHQALAMKLAEAAMAGERPSHTLQDSEKKSALGLAKAREQLRVAMAESVGEKASSRRGRGP